MGDCKALLPVVQFPTVLSVSHPSQPRQATVALHGMIVALCTQLVQLLRRVFDQRNACRDSSEQRIGTLQSQILRLHDDRGLHALTLERKYFQFTTTINAIL